MGGALATSEVKAPRASPFPEDEERKDNQDNGQSKRWFIGPIVDVVGVGCEPHRRDGEGRSDAGKVACNQEGTGEKLDHGTDNCVELREGDSSSLQDGVEGGGSDEVLDPNAEEREGD